MGIRTLHKITHLPRRGRRSIPTPRQRRFTETAAQEARRLRIELLEWQICKRMEAAFNGGDQKTLRKMLDELEALRR